MTAIELSVPDARARHAARLALGAAVRSGRIIRPEGCERCGTAGPVQAHHADYTRPLEVEWVCTGCHGPLDAHTHRGPRSAEARERGRALTLQRVRGRMRLTYDPDADALLVELLPGARAARTTRPGILERLDFDAEDRLIAVEVLKASTRYPRAQLEQLESPVEELTLAQCSEESGIDTSTLRHQIARGKLPARKVGRDWLVRGNDLMTYLENRAPSGRPGRVDRKVQLRRKVTKPKKTPAHARPPAKAGS